MNTRIDLSGLSSDIVYVKPVAVDSLPKEVRDRVGDLQVLFSVHDTEGTQLALVANRNLAFALARQHDKVPVALQ
jgi:hypothetical protein